MKKLTKIKLINWHGFINETIEVKDSILLLGENGSGKSTLIDAIYYLISGGKENMFNVAANENATRTLESYMRGKLGMENKKELRSDPNLVSHIALEFFDDMENEYFVLGIALEIQENTSKTGEHFYYVKNSKLKEEYFLKLDIDGKPLFMNFKAMQKEFGKDKIENFASTKKEARRKLLAILGVESEKYFDLLPKAIAFKPIPDVSKFVYDFLMPEKVIDIQAVRTNIKSYNDIQVKIEADSKKQKELEVIINLGESYFYNLLERKLLEYYKCKLDLENNVREQLKNKAQKEKQEYILKENQEHLQKIKNEILQFIEIIIKLESNDAYKAVKIIEQELGEKFKEKNKAEKAEAELNNLIIKENKILRALDIEINFNNFIKSKNEVKFLEALKDYKNKFDLKLELIRKTIYEDEKNINSLTAEVNEKKLEQEKLEQGISTYSKSTQALMDIIEGNLGSMTKAVPLCELIDIKDGEEEWQNAVEGFLNTKRFDLFVLEECYDDALALYEKCKKDKKIYNVGLVNISKLRECKVLDNSLATKVTTNDSRARKYIDFLLGDIICVESEQDLKKYDSSITKTVMVYKNKASRQTKFAVYEIPFIGQNSKLKRIELIKENVKKLYVDIQEKKIALEKNKNIENIANFTKYLLIVKSTSVWGELDKIKVDISELEEKLKELKPLCGTIGYDVDKYKNKKVMLEQEEDVINDKITSIKAKIDNLNFDIKKKESIIEQLNLELESKNRDEDVSINIDSYMQKNVFNAYEIDGRVKKAERECYQNKMMVEQKMSEYIRVFGFDATASIDSLGIFKQESVDVVGRNLIAYQSDLDSVKQKAVETFKNSYIYEIRNNIQTEKKNVEKLNKVLSNKGFGSNNEVYKFEISKSKDKDFAQYYDIFMSNEDFEINDLFTESLSDRNLELMQDLFARLSVESNDAKQEKIIKEYTDYRSFMSYDIKITDKDDNVSYFSKINKEKSGGETQTPFYVIVAASFDQIVHSGYARKSSACLIILDEAFNNMDSARIDSMMKYFKSLKIQPIIAVPSQRAKTIFPYVDTIIPLAKSNNIIKARPIIQR